MMKMKRSGAILWAALWCACADSSAESHNDTGAVLLPGDMGGSDTLSPDVVCPGGSDMLDVVDADFLPTDTRFVAEVFSDSNPPDFGGDGSRDVDILDTSSDVHDPDGDVNDATSDVVSPPALLGKTFALGLSANNGAAEQGALLGLDAVRPTFSWRTVEPTASVTGLTLEDVTSNAAVSDYVLGRDWSGFDSQAKTIADAGLEVTPIIGHGFSSTLPLVDGIPGSPDVFGMAEYLARQYLVTRATVERFDGDGVLDSPTGVKISVWQIENELNQAMLTAVLGWRTPDYMDGISSAWADWSFLTELLATLRQAVFDADPNAQVTTNFHTDIHPGINQFFDLPSWTEAIVDWAPLVDWISIDAYPNYYQASPPKGDIVGERVAMALSASGGKPVFVMESGYPTGPAELGYDEEKQAQFMMDALRSAKAAGAVGFYWFGTQTPDVHSVVITATDLENMSLLASAFESGDAATLMSFALNQADYVQGQLKEVGLAVEAYWGLVRPDGSRKPAWYVLAGFAAANP